MRELELPGKIGFPANNLPEHGLPARQPGHDGSRRNIEHGGNFTIRKLLEIKERQRGQMAAGIMTRSAFVFSGSGVLACLATVLSSARCSTISTSSPFRFCPGRYRATNSASTASCAVWVSWLIARGSCVEHLAIGSSGRI